MTPPHLRTEALDLAPARPLIAVLVGTDHHPFDRLVDWCLQLADEGWARWFIQYGASHWPEAAAAGAEVSSAEVVGSDGLARVLEAASGVVLHGGPGLLMDAWQAGHRPVVVARDPELGEHVDGHQQRFARHLENTDRALVATDLATLRSQIAVGLASRGAPGAGRDTSTTLTRFSSLVETTVQHRRGVLR